MKNSKTRGATKVPNVKLRPAQASSSRASKRQTSLPRVGLREDEAAQGDVDLSAGNKPFKGIVLCATGDLDKRSLFAHAQELGAIRANDFTDQVTHLVADAPGSAKYRCALERHLPILRESWVEEAYRTWLNGEVVNLEQSIADHRLPIFSGVRLCLTGMDDLKVRTRIHSLLARENGVYLKSLDKTATHLLSCAAGDSPKLQWASDYNKTQQSSDRIHLVWEEWFWDSIEFEGRWDEREYEITKPRPSRKILSQVPRIIEDDPQDNDLPAATPSQHTPLPSSLPTSALFGDDPPEYGNVNKVPQARQLFYSNIFQKRDKDKDVHSTNDVKTAPGPTLPHVPLLKQGEETFRTHVNSRPRDAHRDPASDSVITRLANHRVASFGSTSEPQWRQPFRRIVSSTCSVLTKEPQASSSRDASTSKAEIASRLFAGYTFRAFGEARSPNLREALEAHGGRWLTEADEETDFLIVRLVSGGMYWREEGDVTERAKYRTECWLERCIFEERICAPHEHVVFTPLKVETPIIGSEKLQLSLSGLDTAEASWVKRLIRVLGGNLLPTFSRRSTHLICPSMRGAKFEKAKEWGVDVVGMEWLIQMATTGEIPAARNSLLHAILGLSTLDADIKQDVKGKGKAREDANDEEMIIDITNSLSQEFESLGRHGSLSTLQSSNAKPQTLMTPGPAQSAPPELPSSLRTRVLPRNLHLESEVTFGNPTGLLSGASVLTRQGVNLEPGPSSPLIIQTPSSRLPSISPNLTAKLSRRLSATEVEQDKQMTLIPSSHSPSPLNIPKQALVSSPTVGETRGLRTAITALLGKRSKADGDETDSPAQKQSGRMIKKARHISRTKSDLEPRHGPSPAVSLLSGSPPLSRLPHFEDMDAIPEEEQASLRVVYEDPGQTAEKRRLNALFESGTTSDMSKTGGARPAVKKKYSRKSRTSVS